MSEKIRPIAVILMLSLFAQGAIAAKTRGDVGDIKLENLYVHSVSVAPVSQQATVILGNGYSGPYLHGTRYQAKTAKTREMYPVTLDLNDAGDSAMYDLALSQQQGAYYGQNLSMTVANGTVTELKSDNGLIIIHGDCGTIGYEPCK